MGTFTTSDRLNTRLQKADDDTYSFSKYTFALTKSMCVLLLFCIFFYYQVFSPFLMSNWWEQWSWDQSDQQRSGSQFWSLFEEVD